jgi:hypothetical protein
VRHAKTAYEQHKHETPHGINPAQPSRDIVFKPIYPTILADPTVPASAKELSQLQDDAIFLLMAGTDAPGQVLAITMFHVLNNPHVHKKLMTELVSAMPEPTATPDLSQLENLPYLVCCVMFRGSDISVSLVVASLLKSFRALLSGKAYGYRPS